MSSASPTDPVCANASTAEPATSSPGMARRFPWLASSSEMVGRSARRPLAKAEPRLLGVDYFRGVAAVAVVLFHASLAIELRTDTAPFGGLFNCGAKGVDLFFVLSGFIILYTTWPHIGQRDYWGTYAARRALRILPLLWVVAIGLVLAAALAPSLATSTNRTFECVITSLLLIPWPTDTYPAVAWTLKHEALFYALFSLCFFAPRVARWGAVLWIGVCTANIWSVLPHHFVLDWLFSPYNVEFALGMVCAALLRRVALPRPGLFVALGGLGLLIAGVCYARLPIPEVTYPWMPNPPSPWILVFGPLSAITLLGVAQLDLQGRMPLSRTLFWLGAASYSIYLVHVPALKLSTVLLGRLLPEAVLSPEACLLATAVLSTIGAVIFWRVVEQPLTAWLRRRLLSKAPATVGE